MTMEDEGKKLGCSGRCENCNVNQRTYCASQMAYYTQNEIAEMKAIIISLVKSKYEDSIMVLREEDKPVEVECVTPDAGTRGENFKNDEL